MNALTFTKLMYFLHIRYAQVYTNLHGTVARTDPDQDLKWWSTSHGVDMPMAWPAFEVSHHFQNVCWSDFKNRGFVVKPSWGDNFLMGMTVKSCLKCLSYALLFNSTKFKNQFTGSYKTDVIFLLQIFQTAEFYMFYFCYVFSYNWLQCANIILKIQQLLLTLHDKHSSEVSSIAWNLFIFQEYSPELQAISRRGKGQVSAGEGGITITSIRHSREDSLGSFTSETNQPPTYSSVSQRNSVAVTGASSSTRAAASR